MGASSYLEDQCKSALNRLAPGGGLPYRWTLNAYRGCTHDCHYCFARAYHPYLDLGMGGDFARRIVVKTNVAEVLRRELSSPSWTGEPVAMGAATDPYQPAEARYRLTREVLETLIEFRTPLSLLTKSTLIVRDIELLKRLDDRAGVTVAMSVGTLDDSVRQKLEPGTPPARSRLEILRRLSAAGIRTGVVAAPILPFLTDEERQLTELVDACASAGVDHLMGVVLHIRPGIRSSGIRSYFWPWLEHTMPAIYPRYRRLYAGRSHPPAAYRAVIAAVFARAKLEGSPARLIPQPRIGTGAQLSLAI